MNTLENKISFQSEICYSLDSSSRYRNWLREVITSENKQLGVLTFVFCDDKYLLEINKKFLDHDYFTDIITFDYTDGNMISGDIIISVDRVTENAALFKVTETEEMKRVMAHGVLHLLGYSDKTDGEQKIMRRKETEKINMFHVEQ